MQIFKSVWRKRRVSARQRWLAGWYNTYGELHCSGVKGLPPVQALLLRLVVSLNKVADLRRGGDTDNVDNVHWKAKCQTSYTRISEKHKGG